MLETFKTNFIVKIFTGKDWILSKAAGMATESAVHGMIVGWWFSPFLFAKKENLEVIVTLTCHTKLRTLLNCRRQLFGEGKNENVQCGPIYGSTSFELISKAICRLRIINAFCVNLPPLDLSGCDESAVCREMKGSCKIGEVERG